MDTTKGPICVPFLNGITSTSVDHSQINITCLVTANNASTLTATVSANMKASSLTIGVLTYDPVVL